MPTVKKHLRGKSKVADPLGAGAFEFFGTGPYFDGEDYESATTEEARREHWAQYKHLYIERFRTERPELAHLASWGEHLAGGGKL